ncbi:uncharacterized protein LOC126574430 [Anopheles aquasalis]|uniref:uncharacterized protein LOC126574430 n=1 Tax=Anopheles aquasalis TaxID=42839 RepID=UPI00215B140B|nr:uncharacterized protein LOC126574430 [Anopheles aquasalis]
MLVVLHFVWAYEFCCKYETCTVSNVNIYRDGLYVFSFVPNGTIIIHILRVVGHLDLSIVKPVTTINAIAMVNCVFPFLYLPQLKKNYSVSIRDALLGEVYFEPSDTLIDVRMHNTSLSQFPPSLLVLPNLHRLDLRFSLLRQLNLGELKRLYALEELNVASNRITTVTIDEERLCCSRLRWLNLGANWLVQFDFGLVFHLPALTGLFIGYNKLEALSTMLDEAYARKHNFCSWKRFYQTAGAPRPSCRDYFARLDHVSLTKNNLKTLNMSTFGSMNVLQDLDVALNPIREVIVDELQMPVSLNVSTMAGSLGYRHALWPSVLKVKN